jgi:hypothetical protein
MATIDFSEPGFADSIRTSLLDMQSLGVIPDRVQKYFDVRQEVNPRGLVGDLDALKKRMWSYLRSRGVKLDKDSVFNAGGYDEILFAAYDAALKADNGGGDPLAQARNGGKFDGTSSWDFSVETFESIEDQGISAESIRAAGAIDYIYEIGERIGVFRIAEALVLNWSSGAIDVVDGNAAAKLYKYWKEMDDRSDPAERGMLYRRVIGKGDAKVLSRMVVNDQFPHLWSALMGEVAKYIDKSEQIDQGRGENSPLSPQPIYQAIRELQYNLTEFCNGMAFMQTREIYAQLQQAFEIIKDPDIIAQFGGQRRRNPWRVIEELSKREFNRAPPIGPLVRVAVDGNKVFQLVAEFDEGTITPQQLTRLIDASEPYIIIASMAEGPPPSVTNGADAEDEADDFDTGDETAKDGNDDF